MRAAFLCLALSAVACVMPPPPAERVADAARELNLAARFGRMEIALELTDKSVRPTFLEHRAAWGKQIRVLDVELSSFSMPSADRAQIEVDYAWSRVDEGTLRTTRIAQEWRDPGGGFRLVRERRVAGDLGLFGEALPASLARDDAPRRDVQFETKVIR